jgi:hypothetical protein
MCGKTMLLFTKLTFNNVLMFAMVIGWVTRYLPGVPPYFGRHVKALLVPAVFAFVVINFGHPSDD